MPTYGLTSTGFVPKTLEIILAEMQESLKGAFGNSIDLSGTSVFGQLAGIFAERESLLWELAEAVNSSTDPDSATGTALAAICALTGVVQEQSSPSTVDLTLTGTPATLVQTGSQVSVTNTGAKFATTADGTITLLTSWASGTVYSVGDRRTNASRAYICTQAGTSAGSGGPTTTAEEITDNTCKWRYMGEGTGAVDVASECTEDGPTEAESGDITTIVTPVGGWSSVINLLDADLGQLIESDEELRQRRELELAMSGTSTVEAIRADVLEVEDVTSVTVFENTTDVTDGDGMPPHSVEVMVQGGDDDEIAEQVFNSVAAGIQTFGTEGPFAITDSSGNDHDIYFSRPSEVLVYVDVELTKDASEYPLDGDDQVEAAIVAYGDAQRSGKNVVSSALIGAIFQAVPGVLDVTVCHIGTSSNPSASTTIAVSTRELAVYDTSRITVVSVDGVP